MQQSLGIAQVRSSDWARKGPSVSPLLRAGAAPPNLFMQSQLLSLDKYCSVRMHAFLHQPQTEPVAGSHTTSGGDWHQLDLYSRSRCLSPTLGNRSSGRQGELSWCDLSREWLADQWDPKVERQGAGVCSGRRQNPERMVAFLERDQQAKVTLQVEL